jgi:hypothetical protein
VDPALLKSLREAVDGFDFETAQTKLSLIAAECHLSTAQDDSQQRQEAHSAG